VTVSAEPQAVRPGSSVSVPVRFVCQPGYYVWHDSLKAELIVAPPGISIGTVTPPPPKEKYDETLERIVAYVDGTFDVLVEFSIADSVPPGDQSVRFRLAYALCSPSLCQFGQADLQATLVVSPSAPLPASAAGPAAGGQTTDADAAQAGPADDPFAGHSPVVVVLLAFLLGLGLTLTPCVYPLIPVTIGVVGATSGGGRLDALFRSLIYVLGISMTYSAVGVAAAATGGLFGQVAHSPVVYLALAVVFVLLAGGMFEVYTIDLSSQRLQRVQAALRGRAGLVGVLVVGMLSGAAVTACIAPVIIAALAYVATSGNLLLGWVIFFAMAWGMGAPLVLIGTFAGLAQSLPKSGQWMVTVKHVLGFVLLGCAAWFVVKSAVLPEPWPQMIMGGFLLVTSVFAGAFDSIGPDANWRPRLRKAVGLLLLAGAVAAFVKPILVAAPSEAGAPIPGERGVAWVESEEQALALAESEDRPVLIDFWSETCAPCIRMFKTTYVDPRVVAESRRFAVAKVNVDELSKAQLARARAAYGLRGVPTTVFIDTDGNARAVTRELSADEMLELMRATH
jgi:thiol:disulfide interchange protein DsbD